MPDETTPPTETEVTVKVETETPESPPEPTPDLSMMVGALASEVGHIRTEQAEQRMMLESLTSSQRTTVELAAEALTEAAEAQDEAEAAAETADLAMETVAELAEEQTPDEAALTVEGPEPLPDEPEAPKTTRRSALSRLLLGA